MLIMSITADNGRQTIDMNGSVNDNDNENINIIILI